MIETNERKKERKKERQKERQRDRETERKKERKKRKTYCQVTWLFWLTVVILKLHDEK